MTITTIIRRTTRESCVPLIVFVNVWEQVPEVTRRQRRKRHRHDHDERFAQLTQTREDSGELTEGRVGHHALTEVMREEVDVLVDDIEPELGQKASHRMRYRSRPPTRKIVPCSRCVLQ